MIDMNKLAREYRIEVLARYGKKPVPRWEDAPPICKSRWRNRYWKEVMMK